MTRFNRIDPKVDLKTYLQIESRYQKFLDNVNDPSKPIIRVFNPMPKSHLDALEITREVTRTLMKKKEDDIKKQQQQAEEAEREKEEAKRLAAEKKETEVKEEKETEVKEEKETEVKEEKETEVKEEEVPKQE